VTEQPTGDPSDTSEIPKARLTGRRVTLRPVRVADYDWLYTLFSSEELSFRWRFRVDTVPPEQFGNKIWSGVFSQFVVEHTATETPVGLIQCFAADHVNRHAHIALVIDPALHRRAWHLEATGLFVSYIFEIADFRKLYGEAIDFNLKAYASGLRDNDLAPVLVEEGRLRKHVYVAGVYRDLIVLALYRDDWEQHLLRSGRLSNKRLSPG
jgi:[ribosomal protein S5]-alanine N-acetyltransferase